MIQALIGAALALLMAGCPLTPRGDSPSAEATAERGDEARASRTAQGPGGADAAEPCDPGQEPQACNGVDEDCDGVIDEGCAFYLGGHVMGAGLVSAADDARHLAGGLSAQHFLGSSSDGSWVIHAGLPRHAGTE